jgi:hypothetical protein
VTDFLHFGCVTASLSLMPSDPFTVISRIL